ncbi:GumN family protein [Paenibacillus curdlanolyticus YK9]|uniref:GumN family protein n=1 Tax=Paenibacillus curdlanolyticus YK9 TaxID=717606 RepID=E0IES7_9BACL|nr:TraB/GumN family protein [Paenibacillus curdlanolyticus]EFM09165.1 GumN family protein [Paenibacillus curdlanolyticus YK9]
MRFKKLSALFVTVAFILSSFATSAFAAPTKPAPSATVVVDGNPIKISGEQPFVDKGTSFVPLKPLFNELHIALQWNNSAKTLTGIKGDLTIALKIGSTTANVNGNAVQLTAAPRIVNGTTFVPLRFVGEATGYAVGWSQSTNTITLTSKVPQAEASKGFMWKVQNNGNTVYLVGSIHVADKAMYPLRKEYEEAFKAADYLALEVDLTQVDQATANSLITKYGVYTDGTTLKDHISADLYKQVTAILKSRNIKENALDTYKPWVVSQIFSTFQTSDEGYDPSLGIDQYFLNNAIQTKKPIIGLETYEQQIQMFASFSDGLQESQLNETIAEYNNPSTDESGIDQLTEMWKEGDENTLSALAQQISSNEEYYKAMLADRNAGMAEKVTGFLNSPDKKTYFVVVGALHMLGQDGVVTKLRAGGFTVENY